MKNPFNKLNQIMGSVMNDIEKDNQFRETTPLIIAKMFRGRIIIRHLADTHIGSRKQPNGKWIDWGISIDSEMHEVSAINPSIKFLTEPYLSEFEKLELEQKELNKKYDEFRARAFKNCHKPVLETDVQETAKAKKDFLGK